MSSIVPRATGALPLIGHLLPFLRDKLGFLERSARRYGDVVELSLGGPTYLLVHPDDIGHVLAGNAGNYSKSPRIVSRRGQRVGGLSLITADEEEHSRLRRPLLPLLRLGMVQPFGDTVDRAVERVTAPWHDGATVDLRAAMRRLALDCALRVVLGERVADAHSWVGEDIETRRRFMIAYYGSARPLPERWPLPLNRRYRRACERMETILDHCLAAGDESLLGAICSAGGGAHAEILRGQVFTLLVSAYETMADHLAWLCLALARHPECADRLRADVAATFTMTPVVDGHLEPPASVDAFIAETLRMYPPTWMFVRVAREADRLPTGGAIPAGAKIYLSPWVTQRDLRFFPEPERFDPGRFAPETVRQRPRFAFFPFGGGRRLCVGGELAGLVAKRMLTTVVPHWRFELAATDIVPVPSVTLTPSRPLTAVLRQCGSRL